MSHVCLMCILCVRTTLMCVCVCVWAGPSHTCSHIVRQCARAKWTNDVCVCVRVNCGVNSLEGCRCCCKGRPWTHCHPPSQFPGVLWMRQWLVAATDEILCVRVSSFYFFRVARRNRSMPIMYIMCRKRCPNTPTAVLAQTQHIINEF